MSTTNKEKKVIGKSDLIKRTKDKMMKEDNSFKENSSITNISQTTIGKIINTFLDEVVRTLLEGDKVTLQEYFTLETKGTPERIGLNPSVVSKLRRMDLTSEKRRELEMQRTVMVPEGKRVVFRLSQTIKERLSPKKKGK